MPGRERETDVRTSPEKPSGFGLDRPKGCAAGGPVDAYYCPRSVPPASHHQAPVRTNGLSPNGYGDDADGYGELISFRKANANVNGSMPGINFNLKKANQRKANKRSEN